MPFIVATNAMPSNAMPSVITSSNICHGPIGLPMVLPLRTMTAPPIMCTSLCNGSTMGELWFARNTVISAQTTMCNAASWIFVPDLQTGCYVTNGTLLTPPKPRLIIPKAERAGRRVVRRSVDLYARFRGMDEVRRFMRDEEIIYHGERYDYGVRKKLSVLAQAMQPESPHIPYTLRMVDKQTGKYMASGCVVFPSLPIFDQLLALAFHIQDPDEELNLIRTTNWSPRLASAIERQAA